MAIIKAFKGFRPRPAIAGQLASRPYDVLNTAEAREEVQGNPHSFLHVVKPEIDLPESMSPYDDQVYTTGRDNFLKLVEKGDMVQDEMPALYVYRQQMDGQYQSGLVAAAAVADYLSGVVKKHELTRPDKEEDRRKHVRVSGINAEPVFFAYPAVDEIDEIVSQVQKDEPVYDFVAEDGIGHTLWVIQDMATIARLEQLFAEKVPFTYIADGHHRTAAAAGVGEEKQQANAAHTGQELYNYFMAVHFPDDQLRIIDYNRVVKDLNGLSETEFLAKVGENFDVEAIEGQYKPDQLHHLGLYLNGSWYRLEAHEGTYDDSDPVGVLDVSILSAQILAPILDIVDLRRDKRIEFVGGIRGLGELEKRVDSGEMKLAFALYPVSMQQLINISDTDNIMPPKTTWFEPKLRSGLVVYQFEG